MAAQRLNDIGTGARRYFRRGALVVPFIIGPLVVRLAIGPVGNALAGAMMAVAPDGLVSRPDHGRSRWSDHTRMKIRRSS